MKYEKNERSYPLASDSLDALLGEGEEVLWRGKPKKSAYILNKVLYMLPVVLLWLAIDVTLLCVVYILDTPTLVRVFVTCFIAVHLLPFWMWLSGVITASRRYKNMDYALTNRRVIIRSGLIGIDFESVGYKDIVNVNLRVGLIDRMLKVGDLYFENAQRGRKNVFFDIENPYEAYKVAQRVVSDIQTDIVFPNAYRPESNPGYGTKYRNGGGDGQQ